jgi:hypothetical protein
MRVGESPLWDYLSGALHWHCWGGVSLLTVGYYLTVFVQLYYTYTYLNK